MGILDSIKGKKVKIAVAFDIAGAYSVRSTLTEEMDEKKGLFAGVVKNIDSGLIELDNGTIISLQYVQVIRVAE